MEFLPQLRSEDEGRMNMVAILDFLMFLAIAISLTALIALIAALLAVVGKIVWDYFKEE